AERHRQRDGEAVWFLAQVAEVFSVVRLGSADLHNGDSNEPNNGIVSIQVRDPALDLGLPAVDGPQRLVVHPVAEVADAAVAEQAVHPVRVGAAHAPVGDAVAGLVHAVVHAGGVGVHEVALRDEPVVPDDPPLLLLAAATPAADLLVLNGLAGAVVRPRVQPL